MNGSARAADAAIDVAVLGAGPAGVAAALGLRRLGYSVGIFGRPRPTVIEGLSARTVAQLAAAQLTTAAASASTSSPRIGLWGGELAARGHEFLVERADFDRALSLDLAAAGLHAHDRTVLAVAPEPPGWRVEAGDATFRSRAVVDARGRRARGADGRGPRLVSWLERWRTDRDRPRGSAVVALDDGWCWLAADGAGGMQRQFVCAPRNRLTDEGLQRRFAAAAAAVPNLDFSARRAEPAAPLQAKAAVMRRCRPAPQPGLIRIGDAALALDPLSGQGVHEALRSAQVAVAAIRSFLDGADWGPIAAFADQRIAELWKRGLETAGTFYRRQADAMPGAAFWDETATEYEQLAAAAAAAVADHGPPRFEPRPVMNGARIEVRPVWVSARWPRGIWRIARRGPVRRDDPATSV